MPKCHSKPRSPAVNQQPTLYSSNLSLSLFTQMSPHLHPLLYMTTTQTGITSTQPYFTRAHWDSYRDLIPLHSCQSLHNPTQPDTHTHTLTKGHSIALGRVKRAERWRERKRGIQSVRVQTDRIAAPVLVADSTVQAGVKITLAQSKKPRSQIPESLLISCFLPNFLAAKQKTPPTMVYSESCGDRGGPCSCMTLKEVSTRSHRLLNV